MRANERFNERKGSFFAAGLTYYTIFALFPLLMVGFALTGVLLARQPELLAEIENRIRAAVSATFGKQLIELMNSAITSRGSVGVIGLATAAWAGLSWMANLREALSEMWDQRAASAGFVRTKLSDLTAMLSMFAAITATFALTVLADASPMGKLHGSASTMRRAELGLCAAFRLLTSLLVSWLLFTWTIARLPRESISFASSIRAGLIAAVGFEVFKQVASIYLHVVLRSPASATFGPVLGLMVFAYVTARLILFATAWAATSSENLRAAPVQPPGPAVITARVQAGEGLGARQALTAAAMGAVGALGFPAAPRAPGLAA